jgi:hypothetical protein
LAKGCKNPNHKNFIGDRVKKHANDSPRVKPARQYTVKNITETGKYK